MTETLHRAKRRPHGGEQASHAPPGEPGQQGVREPSSEPVPEPSELQGKPVFRRIAVGALAAAIVVLGVIGAATLVRTKPRMARKPPSVPSRVLVHAETVRADDVVATIHAMGTVVPAREVELRPLVSGEVVQLHPAFVPGGIIEEGDELIRIDPRDYELALTRQKAQLAQAEATLVLAEGRRDVAEREWELVQGGADASELDRSLALREPQMRQVQAAVDAAKAAVDEALLSLDRTRVGAPFNCVVVSRNVNLGSQVSPQVPIARLVGTDEFWIRASLPVDRIDWIRFPAALGGDGSRVHVLYGAPDLPARREGRVFMLQSDLETAGRMAQLLVSVANPLGLGQGGETDPPPLLLGDFVRVEIEGRLLEHVVRIPRTGLRDGDTVWVVSPENTLEIRKVRIAWREPQSVLVAEGLADGDRLIVSTVGTPVPGLAVRTANGNGEEAPDADAAGDDEA